MGPLAPGGLVCHSAAVKPLLNRGSPPLAGVTSHRRRPSSRYTGWPARAGRVLPLLHNDSLVSVTHLLQKRQGVGVEFSRRLRLDFSSSTGWAGGAEIAGLEGLIFSFFRSFPVIPGIPGWPLVQGRPAGGFDMDVQDGAAVRRGFRRCARYPPALPPRPASVVAGGSMLPIGSAR